MKKTQLKNQLFFIFDTIGFIENLPSELFYTFSSTLTQLKYTDIILHVIDSSNPEKDLHIETVKNELSELGIDYNNKIIEV